MSKKYHSILFVPAREKYLSKICQLKADMIVIDLEDAIPAEDKVSALKKVKCFLRHSSGDLDIFVRINPDRKKEETDVLNKFPICGYMLPKTESAKDIEKLCDVADGKQIVALIESAAGILNAREIAQCAYTNMIAFGAEDYTAQCGIKNENQYLIYPKSKLVACAKACGKQVFDTISRNIYDRNVCMEDAVQSKKFGFDGKLALHPMQVEVINEVFRNTDILQYERIMDEYSKVKNNVVVIDGIVYEEMHIRAMQRELRENKKE